jgi:voltage-gated potassium channel
MHAIRRRTAELLEVGRADDRSSRFVDIFLIGLILVNVVAIILGSVPSFKARYHESLDDLELFSVIVFTIEYVARIWSSVELANGRWSRPVMGRLRFMLTPMAVIDLLAILPFYLAFLVSIDLRFLRVFRLLRIFKLTRYSAAMGVLLSVLRKESGSLGAAFFVLAVLMVLASSGIYLIEQDIQPDAFGSIPDAMWWAMATLTTVGYGDVTPMTPMGKLFGGVVTVIGMGMVALPAGILAAGFATELGRRKQEFNTVVGRVLEDGVMTTKERTELAELRTNLGLSEQDADLLLNVAKREVAQTPELCPHCSGPLREDPPAPIHPKFKTRALL